MRSRNLHRHVNMRKAGQLTPAECDIRRLLIDTGYSLKEIAAHRGTSYDTVRTQVESIYKKLGVHSRPELLVKSRVPPPSSTPTSEL